MSIKSEKWAEARAMFEGGETLSKISYSTRIERSTISKKAKKEGWIKGLNQQLVIDEATAIAKKSQLNQQQLNFHDEQVEKKTRNIIFIQNATLKNASVMMKKVDKETSHQEHKFVQETLNKAGEALGVINKPGPVFNNSNSSETANEIRVKITKAED